MQVSKISFSPVFNQVKTNKTYKNKINNAVSTPDISPVSFSGNYNFQKRPVKQKDFISEGGKFNFDKAYTGIVPYTGKIVSASGVESYYHNGDKKEVKVSWSKGENSSVVFNDKIETIHPNGSRTVEWYNEDKNAIYFEDYDLDGNLSETYLNIYQSGVKDNLNRQSNMHEIRPYNIPVSNQPSVSIERYYEKGGLVMRKEKIAYDALNTKKFGYSSRVTELDESGNLKKRTYKDIENKEDNTSSDTQTVFYEDSKPVRIEQTNCRLYLDGDFDVPYGMCKKRVVSKKENEGIVIDEFGYFGADKSKGINPIREFAFFEHINTIRQTKRSKETDEIIITYYDGDTKKAYAYEIYDKDNSGFPSAIVNLETRDTLEFNRPAKNILFLNYKRPNGRIRARGAFSVNNGNYAPVQLDIYGREPKTEDNIEANSKKSAVVRFGKNDVSTITYFNPDGTIQRNEKYIGDNLYAESTYSDNRPSVQIITPVFDPKRKIVYGPSNRIVEYTYYGKSDNLQAKTVFENKRAIKRTYYDERGEVTSIETFGDEDEIFLNEEDFNPIS